MTHCSKLKYNIAIIGLGYVGFPLLQALEKTCNNVVGYDISQYKIAKLNKKTQFEYNLTTNIEDIYDKDVYIIAVPTPIDNNHIPDLSYITDATNMIAEVLEHNIKNHSNSMNIVCYESSVAPTTINTVCKEIIELRKNLINNENFILAHAPERMTPADNEHTVSRVCKIIACENEKALNDLRKIYYSIMETEWGGDVVTTTSIEAAEATKMLENIQRDVNIALMNEYSILMNKLNIDMNEILRLAKTRWNFCDFRPGLVGGHCVSVDPYYVIDIDTENTKLMQMARTINDYTPYYIINKTKELLKIYQSDNAKIAILGFAFKENCDDIRNTRVFDIYRELSKEYTTMVIDDVVDAHEVKNVYNFEISNISECENIINCLIVAVPHDKYRYNIEDIISSMLKKYDNESSMKNIIIDIKGVCNNIIVPNNTVIWKF